MTDLLRTAFCLPLPLCEARPAWCLSAALRELQLRGDDTTKGDRVHSVWQELGFCITVVAEGLIWVGITIYQSLREIIKPFCHMAK